jgi:hypothetical protein
VWTPPSPPPFLFLVLEFPHTFQLIFIIVVRHTKRTFVELKEWKKEKKKKDRLKRPFFPCTRYTRGINLMKTNKHQSK